MCQTVDVKMKQTTDPKPLELKPCPFCGSNVAVMTNAPAYDGGPEWFNVECCKCSANVEGGYEETDAITAWNRRAVDREMVERVYRLALPGLRPAPPVWYREPTVDEICEALEKENGA